MKKVVLLAIGVLTMMPEVVMAQADGEKSEQAAAPAPAPEKKICRTDRMTGSLTRRRRICMTEAQWKALAEGTSTSVNNFVSESQRPDRVARDAQLGQGW